jgi:hypothetical protein
LFNWSESIKYTTEINDRNILVSAYLYLGYIIIVSDPYQARRHHEKSLKFSVEVKDYISQAYAVSALGNLDEGMKTGKSGYTDRAFMSNSSGLELVEILLEQVNALILKTMEMLLSLFLLAQ